MTIAQDAPATIKPYDGHFGTAELAKPRVADAEVAALIREEARRQESVLRMIPSENYASKAVMEATGSVLTNKYSEGYAGKRYYQGQPVIDKLETLTIERAKKVFGAEHANVQPYSGSVAVLACYFAVLEAGDKVLGPKLDHGGHLSHGHKVNVTGKIFDVAQYGVSKETENIDLAEVHKLAKEHQPKMIIVGGTAFPRVIDFNAFSEIAREVGAVLLADMSHYSGLIAGGSYPNPFPHADIMVSTSHKTLRGPRGAFILCKEEHAKAVDRAVFPLLQGGPHQHTQAAIAVALFEAMQPAFKEYAEAVVDNCRALADLLAAGGLRIISGGTDNHLILADVTSLGWQNGKDAAVALEEAGIVLNANSIPFDTGTPMKPSGIRFGTPALTTRFMRGDEMKQVAQLMLAVLQNPSIDATALAHVRAQVEDLCRRFPVPDYFV